MSSEPLLTKLVRDKVLPVVQKTMTMNKFKSSIDQAINSVTISRKFSRQGIISVTPNAPNTKFFAITKAIKLIRFDPETQEIECEAAVGKYNLTCVGISEDGLTVVVGNIYGKIFIFDSKTFKLRHHILINDKLKIKSVAISPKGTHAQVLTKQGLIKTNLAKESKPDEPKIQGQKYMLMRSNGDFFLGNERELRLYNLELGVIKTYDVRDIKAIFQTSKYLLVSISGICKIINIESGVNENDVFIPENISFMTLSPDEKLLLIAQNNGIVTVNDLEYEERHIDFNMTNKKQICYIFFFNNNTRFGTLSQESRVSTVDLPKFKSFNTIQTTSNVFTFISEEDIAYIARDSLFTRNIKTKNEKAKLIFHQKGLSPAFLFVEPAYFIMVANTELLIFNYKTNKNFIWNFNKNLFCYHIKANPEVTTLAIFTSNRTIILFSCIEFKYLCELEGHLSIINDMIFLDSNTLASCTNRIFLWSVKDQKQISILAESELQITVLSSRGPYLFFATEDLKISIWNWKLQISVMKLSGNHSNRILSLTITKENLISASNDSIVFWDIDTFTSIFTMKPIGKCTKVKSSLKDFNLCYSNGASLIILENPFKQEEFEIFGGEHNDTLKFLTMLQSITNLNEGPYNSNFTHWVIMPFRVTLGHIFVDFNSENGLKNFIEDGGCIINNLIEQNILSQTIEKNLHICTNTIISGLKKRLQGNPYTFGFVTHEMLQKLNIKGGDSLLKLYECIYKTSFQYGLKKLCPSSVSLPIYYHSNDFEICQDSFFSLNAEKSEEMKDGISVEFKQSLVKLSTDMGSQQSREFLESLHKCPNGDIFKTAFIQDLLIEKWMKVKWILYMQGLLYFFHVVNFTFLVVYPEHIKPMIISLFVMNLLLTFYEIVQLYLLLGAYFSDPWNWIDAFRFVLMNIFICMVWSDVPMDPTQPGFFTMFNLTGFVTILVFLRGISYFRLFETTRYMVDLIQEVLVDMAGFLLILSYSVFSFAFIFYAFSFELPGGDTGLIHYTIFSYMINMGAGETQNNSYVNIIFYLSTLINPIILLNMLISIMGNTFERVEGCRIVANYKELTNLILEAEQLLVSSKKNNDAKYLQSCSEPPPYEPPEILCMKVKKLSINVKNLSTEVEEIKNNTIGVDAKIHNVLQKLHELFEFLKKNDNSTRRLSLQKN